GEKNSALRLILANFLNSISFDIAGDEQLLALRLMKPADPRYSRILSSLTKQLNDPQHVSLPFAHRLFLMSSLSELGAKFPTFEAERLAAQFLEADTARPAEPTLQPSRVPGLWKLTSKKGRMIALYRSETVLAAANEVLQQQNSPSV